MAIPEMVLYLSVVLSVCSCVAFVFLYFFAKDTEKSNNEIDDRVNELEIKIEGVKDSRMRIGLVEEACKQSLSMLDDDIKAQKEQARANQQMVNRNISRIDSKVNLLGKQFDWANLDENEQFQECTWD